MRAFTLAIALLALTGCTGSVAVVLPAQPASVQPASDMICNDVDC
jgi:hypothetical protein